MSPEEKSLEEQREEILDPTEILRMLGTDQNISSKEFLEKMDFLVKSHEK